MDNIKEYNQKDMGHIIDHTGTYDINADGILTITGSTHLCKTINDEPVTEFITNDKVTATSKGFTFERRANDLIRITMPVLTEETRGDYIKQARSEAENAKIAIRNIRRDANNLAKDSEKNNEISQDEMKRLEAEVQRVTDTFIESIENELKKKEADLSEI